jgi:hypothetical protein
MKQRGFPMTGAKTGSPTPSKKAASKGKSAAAVKRK